MLESWSWRSLGTVMLLTGHVALVASILRVIVKPVTPSDHVVLVSATLILALFLSWPIGRGIALAFRPEGSEPDKVCPGCGRTDVRPLVPSGSGLFQPAQGYRCATCLTTFGWGLRGGQTLSGSEPVDPRGITFLDAPLEAHELRFLDRELDS